jgi:Zn-dependent protease
MTVQPEVLPVDRVPEDGGQPPSIPPKPNNGMRTGLVALGLTLLAKGKVILVALKAFKFSKFLLTFVSMITMIWFEAQLGGWIFGVGFVLLILVHEVGHGLAMKRAGLDAGFPVFIPFVGAFISLKGQLRSSRQEAEIAIAGPVAGTLAALLCVALWKATDTRLFLSLAYTGFFLNLFNLTPISPLDGGRVAQMFSRRLWIVGVIGMVAMFFLTWSPQLVLISLLAGSHALSRRGMGALPDEAKVTDGERRWMAAQYFGLAAFLAAGMALSRSLLA